MFAGDEPSANQANDILLDQTDPNFGWESTLEYYNDIPYSGDDEIGYSETVTMSRDGETIYEFTNCGQA